MNCPFVIKKCCRCHKWLVANNYNFSKDRNRKSGLKPTCKKCDKINREKTKEQDRKYQKKYRESHKEETKEYKRQYYIDNKDKLMEYKKQYYIENKDMLSEKSKKYRKENPHVDFNNHCRRRKREENQGNGITKEQWKEMMEFFDWKCAYSGEKLTRKNRTIDHIVALDNNGEHEIWNLVPMLFSYNSSKGIKNMEEWYRKQDFYSEERLQKIYNWQEYAKNKWRK